MGRRNKVSNKCLVIVNCFLTQLMYIIEGGILRFKIKRNNLTKTTCVCIDDGRNYINFKNIIPLTIKLFTNHCYRITDKGGTLSIVMYLKATLLSVTMECPTLAQCGTIFDFLYLNRTGGHSFTPSLFQTFSWSTLLTRRIGRF